MLHTLIFVVYTYSCRLFFVITERIYIHLLIYPLINNSILLVNALPSILSKMVAIIP